MKRTPITIVAIGSVALILFLIAALVIPFDRSTGFWFSFSAGVFAILFLTIVSAITLSEANNAKRFLGLSIVQVASYYVVLQVVWSFVCMGLPILNWVNILVAAVLLAGTLIILIGARSSAESIQNVDASVVKDRSFYDNTLGLINNKLLGSRSADQKTAFEKVRDELRYSDPISAPESAVVEARIVQVINDLSDQNMLEQCVTISQLLKERQAIIKNNK